VQHGHWFCFCSVTFLKRKLTGEVHDSILNNNCMSADCTSTGSSKISQVRKCSKNSQFLTTNSCYMQRLPEHNKILFPKLQSEKGGISLETCIKLTQSVHISLQSCTQS
jgi:hypothetical protein